MGISLWNALKWNILEIGKKNPLLIPLSSVHLAKISLLDRPG